MGIFQNIGNAITGALGGNRKQAAKQEDDPRFVKLRDYREMYGGEQYERRGLQPSWDKYPAGRRQPPMRFQKPSTQYDLPRLIVDRPTAMLFGEGRFPEMSLVPAQEGTDVVPVNKWLAAIAEEGELQHTMLVAARQGASMGTAVITWCVVEGEFEFEAHPALFCKPTFHPRKRRQVIALEKRYKFQRTIEQMTTSGPRLVVKDFWHREVWDENTHIVYDDVLVPDDGSEPIWKVSPDNVAEHNYGRCPVAWIKNLDDGDVSQTDGISLLHGISDITEDIDRTLSQKSRAVRYNQDPERIYFGLSEEQLKKLNVGGGFTTNLPPKSAGADVALLELKGEGQSIAEQHVVSQRGRALETARVIAPEPERLLAAAESGAALNILFSPMLELVGEMRTCYGRGLKDILTQILDVARRGKLTDLGSMMTQPPSPIPDGKIKLTWGKFFNPTPQDLLTISQSVQILKNLGIIDEETLLQFLSTYLNIKDVQQVLELARAEADEKQQNEMAASMGMGPRPRAKKGGGAGKMPKEPASKSASEATDEGE